MTRRSLLVGLLGVLALVGACTDGEPAADPAADDEVQLGDGDIGNATLAGLGDGAPPVELAGLRGLPAVINFWATTCAPCVQEMPALESVHVAAGGAVAFVGVAVRDRVDDALAFAERTGVTYLMAADPNGEFFVASGAVLLPTTLVLDADGEIVRRLTGAITAEELVDVLAEETGVEVPAP